VHAHEDKTRPKNYNLNGHLSALRGCLVALKAGLHPEPSWPELQERCQHNPQIPFQALVKHRNSANVDDLRASTEDPSIRQLLGLEGDLGLKLGLTNGWAYNVSKLVGNYGEIYDRNLGPDTPTYIPRGVNSLWTDGGLIYSPPIK